MNLPTILRAAAMAAALTIAGPAVAGEPIALSWEMLIPAMTTDSADDAEAAGATSAGATSDGLRGVVSHGETGFDQAANLGTALVDAYNGKTVTLPGYVVPLDYDAEGTKNFLLVPFVGACVHVPPPPPNQIVLVTSETPIQFDEMFQAVAVTGIFDKLSIEMELAEIGYKIAADRVAPYQPAPAQ